MPTAAPVANQVAPSTAPAPAPAPTVARVTASRADSTPCPITSDQRASVACALDHMEGYMTEVCACTTMACATSASDRMDAFLPAMAKQMADVQPTKAEDARADALAGRMSDCMIKLSSAPSASTPAHTP